MLEYVGFAAPNGEMVPAKIVQQPDGDFKVEYSSKYTGSIQSHPPLHHRTLPSHKYFHWVFLHSGRHTVEILYAGQAIMGSPFYVEIYDPNKIKVLGAPNSMVGQRVEFESKFSLFTRRLGGQSSR